MDFDPFTDPNVWDWPTRDVLGSWNKTKKNRSKNCLFFGVFGGFLFCLFVVCVCCLLFVVCCLLFLFLFWQPRRTSTKNQKK